MRSVLPALLSGVLAGLSFPPFGFTWLVWFSLVPLLWVSQEARTNRSRFGAGYVAGLVFFLMTLHPLVSGSAWTGWVVGADAMAERQALIDRQIIALHFLWLLLAAWGALFWGAFTLALSRLAGPSLWRMAAFAPPLALLLIEWLRAQTTWDYQWAFLGSTIVHIAPLVQLAALGGVWLLTWLIVFVNVGILAIVRMPGQRQLWPLPLGVGAVLGLVTVLGALRVEKLDRDIAATTDGVRVAAIQYFQPKTDAGSYTTLGLERAYLEVMALVARGDVGDVDLIVLPESVALGALSLDGSTTDLAPVEIQWPLDNWQQAIAWVVGQGADDLDIIMGLDTIEDGRLHNSVIFWEDASLGHVYHKQRLVPFSEYEPEIMGILGMSGRLQYHGGESARPGTLGNMAIGAFICQEVQTPDVIRHSVQSGAEILVSGGNDGVFADPAVAESHARLARLRAVETGRFIVRAMKTGISQVISPTGREVDRTSTADSEVLVESVYPLSDQTLYTRLGDWPLWLALGILLTALTLRRRSS